MFLKPSALDYLTYLTGHYNPSIRIIVLVSDTTYVVCLNFICKWRDLQFKVDTERQICWESFQGDFINSQILCQKSAERKSPIFYFDVWPRAGTLAFTSNKPAHYPLDNGTYCILSITKTLRAKIGFGWEQRNRPNGISLIVLCTNIIQITQLKNYNSRTFDVFIQYKNAFINNLTSPWCSVKVFKCQIRSKLHFVWKYFSKYSKYFFNIFYFFQRT